MRVFFAGAGLVLVSIIVSLLVVEVAVRLFFPEPVRPRFTVDSSYGIRGNEPNLEVKYSVPGDYEAVIRTNNDGMRGTREYDRAKPADICRIAVIGDSFAFGEGVEDDEIVSARLEALLTGDAAEARLEVLNFAVPGIGTAEELILYRRNVARYVPDVVVVLYYDNDTGNSVVSGLFRVDEAGALRDGNDEYLPGVASREALDSVALLSWLNRSSQGWNVVRNRLSSFIHQQRLAAHGLNAYEADDPEAVRLTGELLRRLVADIADDGAEPVVFIVPEYDMTSNFPLTRSELEALGATVTDGRGILGAGDYYDGDPHWRASGHEKAAHAILRAIAPVLSARGGNCASLITRSAR